MPKSADQSLVRQTNQRAVLETIYKNGPISRAELARTLSMSKPTSSSNINQLIELGVIREVMATDRHPGVGRQPVLVDFNEKLRYIFAIDLNYQDPIFSIMNLKGEILDIQNVKLSERIIREMPSIIEKLLLKNNIVPDEMFCIGVSSPGMFTENGRLYSLHTKYKSWYKGDLASELSQRFGVPVYIKNDANAGAVGELLFGAGVGLNDFIYLSCGVGLGAGIILNGKLYESGYRQAGDISYYTDRQKLGISESVEDNVCISGFLKSVRSKAAYGSQLSALAADDRHFSDVVAAYAERDPLVVSAVRDTAEEIACMAMGLSGFLGIGHIIFGGEYIVFQDEMLSVASNVFERYRHPCKIITAKLARYAGLYGVFGIARERLFEKICLQPLEFLSR